MENSSLTKIKSKYIIKKIFDITYDNLKYKLFNHTKHFQEILGIKLIDYKEKYWIKKGIKLDEYLSLKTQKNYNPKCINKKSLFETLKSFIDKNNINLDALKSYLIEYYTNQKNLKKEKLILDIFSPFFDELSKSECFDLFIIPIEMDLIEKNQLISDYRTAFENINKNELNNICIKINYRNEKDIEALDDININYEKIEDLDIINIGNEKNINYDNIFKKIFLAPNFGKNLKKLNLKIHDIWGKINDIQIFEKINNYSNLISLELNGFQFQKNFELKSKNISSLILRNCSDIILSDSEKLENIIISNTTIIKNKSLSNFKNINNCELINYRNDQNFNTIIDFDKLINLKNLICLPHDFVFLTNNSLVENIDLIGMGNNSKDIESKMIGKIFKLKHLKNINFCLSNDIDFEEIIEENEINNSLEQMHIMFKENIESSKISAFIKKFKNLSKLKININIGEEESIMELNINEDKKCKIDKISLYGLGLEKFEIVCGPYSNLIELEFHENGEISNLEESFPLFNKNCDIKFNKLTKFIYTNWELALFETPLSVIENVYNNLTKITNLKIFEFYCICSEINKELYEKFITKLLEMKLDSIKFSIIKKDEEEQIIDTDNYTDEELIELYPDALTNKNYIISKYPEIDE